MDRLEAMTILLAEISVVRAHPKFRIAAVNHLGGADVRLGDCDNDRANHRGRFAPIAIAMTEWKEREGLALR
jgi:hypothetical protein